MGFPSAARLARGRQMAGESSVRFVDLETALASRGLRMAVITTVPSLWSDAARGMAAVKELECLAVAFDPRDETIPRWTGCPNAPVALYANELPRTGWAEILTLLERLGGKVSLVPGDPAERASLFGLSHEVCGEMGLGWIRRFLLLHSSFSSGGSEGFPLPVAKYLPPVRLFGGPRRAGAAKVPGDPRSSRSASGARGRTLFLRPAPDGARFLFSRRARLTGAAARRGPSDGKDDAPGARAARPRSGRGDHAGAPRAPRSHRAALVRPARPYSLISSTVFFTDWKDFSNIAFSSAVSSFWKTFSTPPEPITTGTPM